MQKRTGILAWALSAFVATVLLFAGPGVFSATSQTQPSDTAKTGASTPMSDQDMATLQDQLIQLLRTSPTLTTVVARDPSLLADQQYVSRNNPQLAQFLVQHPEIARNPEYYLFTHIDVARGSARAGTGARCLAGDVAAPGNRLDRYRWTDRGCRGVCLFPGRSGVAHSPVH